jgi:hypothetical protein
VEEKARTARAKLRAVLDPHACGSSSDTRDWVPPKIRGNRLVPRRPCGPLAAGFVMTLLLGCVPVPAIEFPGPVPGPAQGEVTGTVWRLENQILRGEWALTNGVRPVLFENRLNGQAWPQTGSELFRLGFDPVQHLRYAAIRLGADSIEVLVSRAGTGWVTAVTLSRADFPGVPGLLKVGKMGDACANVDSWPAGPLGDCWLEGAAIYDAQGRALAPADVADPGEWTLLQSTNPATVVTRSNSCCFIRARADVHAMLTHPLPPQTAWVACGLGRGTDQGGTYSPALALEWPDGNYLKVVYLKAPNCFVISSPAGDQAVQPAGLSAVQIIDASQFQIIAGPFLRPAAQNPASSRTGDRLPGLEIFAGLRHEATGLTVDWRVVLRDGANYLRPSLTVRSTNRVGQITRVQMLDLRVAGSPARIGVVAGSPTVAGQVFCGAETPLATTSFFASRVRYEQVLDLPQFGDVAWDFGAVVGVFTPGQLRRSFLYYLERERARAYEPIVNWNSWFDTLTWVTEATVSNAIEQCELELRQRRGAAVHAYSPDDGYDDPAQGFWAYNQKFPSGLDLLREQTGRHGTHLGMWLPPLGGFDGPGYTNMVAARRLSAKVAGVHCGEYDLAVPTYYAWWLEHWNSFQARDNVRFFKWDHAGNFALSPHYAALLRSADELRAAGTNIYINPSWGSWPSPFWLNHVDSIWRGGNDGGFIGPGNHRERWITYRDGDTYRGVVQAGPLYPLNSLMVHGVQYGRMGYGAEVAKAGPDFRNEIRTFFGSGTQLQELYISPSMMLATNWDHLAESIRWAAANAATLVDTHWVGGDPNLFQPYGWASWSARKGILVLRNPADQPQSLTLDIGTAFELPADAPAEFSLITPYADLRVPVTKLQSGSPAHIELQPFEILVLEALPRTNYAGRVLGFAALAYWRLGETTGLLAADSAGNHPGEYATAPRLPMPGALLDGDDGALAIAAPGSQVAISGMDVLGLSGAREFTLAGWVQFAGLPAAPDFAPVFAWGANSAEPAAGFALGFRGSSVLEFQALGLTNLEAAIPPLEPASWHHIAAARRRASVELYLDGQLVGTGSWSNVVPASGPLKLGWGDAHFSHPFPVGALDEMAIFGRALTASELHLLFQARAGLLDPPMVTDEPIPVACMPGCQATFSVAVAGSTPMAFQWYFNGAPVAAGTQATLPLPPASRRWVGDYFVVVNNLAGAVTSRVVTLTLQVAPGYAGGVLADGPVAYWRLGETGGHQVHDHAGAHHGKVLGNPVFHVPGALTHDHDAAMRFGGSANDGVDVAFGPELNAPSFSVSLWARVTGGVGTWRSPLASRSVTPLGGHAFYAAPDGTWGLQSGTQVAGHPVWQWLQGPEVVAGAWTHLAATCDGQRTAFFVDGEEAVAANGQFFPNLTRPLRIGCGGTEGGGDFPFFGDVDEVAVFDYALTPQQVREQFANRDGSLRLQFERLGAEFRLVWVGVGVLEGATEPHGLWQEIEGASSPWLLPPAGSQRFFRVRISP